MKLFDVAVFLKDQKNNEYAIVTTIEADNKSTAAELALSNICEAFGISFDKTNMQIIDNNIPTNDNLEFTAPITTKMQ